MARREYPIELMINNKKITKVIIDPHYEENHSDSVNDRIILELVRLLDGRTFQPSDIDEDGFEYYVSDYLEFELKPYKLIWLLQKDQFFVGIVNTYRRNQK
jgi:hypothetical protein